MKFLDLIHDTICSNLEQIVSFPTRKDHVLVLFMTNRPSLVNRCEPLPGIVDHDIVYIDITAIFFYSKDKQAYPAQNKLVGKGR